LLIHFPNRVKEIEQRLVEIDKSVEEIPKRVDYLAEINKTLEDKEAFLSSVDKKIETENDLSDVLNYLNKIQVRFGTLKFEMSVVKEMQNIGYAYKVLSIMGEGKSQTVLGMIRAFDKGPKILNIESLSLRGIEGPTESGNLRTIIMPFTITMKAMFADLKDLPPISRTVYDVKPLRGPNVFLPLISARLQQNTEGLIEVERATLQAILSKKAIIIDHSGKIHTLKEGSEVYLGYLTKINLRKNRVEFTLNKGGVVEQFFLNMSFQQND